MTLNEHDNPEADEELPATEPYPFSARYPRAFPVGQPETADGAAAAETPGVPAMEPLPDPDALPDPGFPVMPAPGPEDGSGDEQYAPAFGSAGEPGAPDEPGSPDESGVRRWSRSPDWPSAPPVPPAPPLPFRPVQATPPVPPAPPLPFRPVQATPPVPPPSRPAQESQAGPLFRPVAAGPSVPSWPAAPERPGPSFRPADPGPPQTPGAAETPRQAWPDDPYAATRAPDEAPPLRGPSVPWSEVRAAADYEAAEETLAPPPALRPHPATGQPFPGQPSPRGAFPEQPLPGESFPVQPLPGEPAFPRDQAAPGEGAPFREQAFPAERAQPGRYALPAQPELTEEIAPGPTSDALTSDLLLPGKRATPDGGWRRTVYRATGGLVRVGESSASMRRRDLVSRIRTPVAGGHHRVAVLSLKGGVGKTTATVGLGATLASLRGDRVIAVDGNPDRGTLSDKVRLETRATIRDLLNQRATVGRYADVRAFTSQGSSRLEILASDRDPGVSVAFSADDYRAVAGVLEHYYSICITDCGTGLLHSAMAGILELADQIVLVSSPSVDGARSASATLDWLDAHGYGDLVRGGVVVLSGVRRKSKSAVDLDRLEQHFAARCRALVRVPYDTHLEEGAEFELEYLDTETAEAYLTLAALVADGFAHPRRPVSSAAPGVPLA